MENIFNSIGREIDKSLMESYFGKSFAYTTNTDAPPLTLASLQKSMQKWRDEKQEYTRQFWIELILKRSSKPTFIIVRPDVIKTLEEEALLDFSARPAWVHVSEHAPIDDDLYICECPCLCHNTYLSMTRRLLANGNWCCVCSRYEDI